jgi:uncharacterized membrane protein
MVLFRSRKARPVTRALIERGHKQLRRLEVFTDVVFALAFFRVFMILPSLGKVGSGEKISIREFFADNLGSVEVIIIGVLMILIYWSNTIKAYGNLDHTDGRHASLSFLQLFFLLLYLYCVRMELTFKGELLPLLLQSITLAIVGFLGVFAWSYALKDRRLISDSITDREAAELRLEFLNEPVTALITIPFVWVGTTAWTLAWLAGLLVLHILNWLHSRKDWPESETTE